MKVDRKNTSNSVFWSAVESAGLAFFSFVSLIVFARLLTPSDFGLFAMLLSLMEVLGIISNMTFHDSLVQRKVVSEKHFDTAFTVTIIICSILSAICWLGGPVLNQLTGDQRAGSIMAWLGVSLFLSGMSATLAARKRRQFEFRSLALRSLVGRFFGALVGILAALYGAGVWSLVIQQLLTMLLGTMVLWATHDKKPRIHLHAVGLRELIGFGATSVLGLLASFTIKRLFIFSVGVYLGPALAGYINIAFRTVDTLWSILAMAISQVALPTMSRLQSDIPRLKYAYSRAVSLTCLALYSSFVGLSVLAPEVVELLFGRKWLPSSTYVTVLSLLVLLQAPRLFVSPLLTALGRPHLVLIGHLIGLAYMVLAILVSELSSPSVVVSVWVVGEIVYVPISWLLLRRATGLTFWSQYRDTLIPFFAAMVMALFLLSVRNILPTEITLFFRFCVLVPTGIVAFSTTLFLIDRTLFDYSITFARDMVR